MDTLAWSHKLLLLCVCSALPTASFVWQVIYIRSFLSCLSHKMAVLSYSLGSRLLTDHEKKESAVAKLPPGALTKQSLSFFRYQVMATP